MNIIDNLEILLYYTSEEAGVWTMQSLEKGQGIIGVEELTPNGFYHATGGIQLKKDRIYCFLDDSSADDLMTYVYFLFSSLVQLNNKQVPQEFLFLIPDDTNLIAKIFHMDGSKILLQSHGAFLTMDYLDSKNSVPDRRGSPYFQSIRIDTQAWINTCFVALEEYFSVAQNRILKVALESENKAQLLRLIQTWTQIKIFWNRNYTIHPLKL